MRLIRILELKTRLGVQRLYRLIGGGAAVSFFFVDAAKQNSLDLPKNLKKGRAVMQT